MSDISLGVISTSVVINVDAVQGNADSAAQSIQGMAQQISVSVGNINNTIKIMADNTAANLEASRQRMVSGINTLSNVALGAGTAITAALGSAVKSAADFDSALHEVSANAGLSAAEFKKMHDGILAIAKDGNVRDTPAQLAKGLYNVVSAGFSGQKALDVLHEGALGAAAGLTDTMTATNALTTVLNSGIKGVSNEREAMDILLKTVEQGKMKFPELANNIAKVLPSASAMGISIQDVCAALVSFTRQGQPVARATTDLTNLISKIAHPTRESTGEFKKLGIEYGVNALKVKGLTGVMDDIIRRTKGHTDTLLKIFPELRAYRGAVEAAQNGGKTWHDILVSLSHATDGQGQTMKAATEVNKGAEQQAAKLRQQIETLKTEIGEKLLPVLKNLMSHVKDLIKWWQGLSEGTKSNTLTIAAWIGGIVLTFGVIGKFLVFLNAIRTAYLAIAGAAGIAQAAQAGAGAAGAAGSSFGVTAGAGGAGVLSRVLPGLAGGAVLALPAVVGAYGAKKISDESEKGSEEEIRAGGLNSEAVAKFQFHLAKLQQQLKEHPGDANLAKRIQEVHRYLGDVANPNGAGKPSVRAATEAQAAAEKKVADAKAAAAKADADYAKAGLAHDPFPGSKDPKAKKGKKNKDKDDEDEGERIADQIKNATKTSAFSASCAFFVSQVLRLAGAGVKGSDSVRQLWKNIAEAGGEVVTGELKKGDILKFHGKNFGTDKDAEGKGNHTGIYVGDGMFTDSHDHNTRRTTRSLASYMKANPDADMSAMRLGDKDDRASNLFSARADKQKEDAQTLKENKDKVEELTDALFKLTHSEDEVAARDYLKQFRENYKTDPKAATALLIAQMDELAAKRKNNADVELASLEYTAEEQRLTAEANAKFEEELDADKKQRADADVEVWRKHNEQIAADMQREADVEAAIMDERMGRLETMSKGDLLYMLARLQQERAAIEKAGGTGSAAWNEKNKQVGQVQGQIDAPLNEARAKMTQFLQSMRQNFENILGGALEKIFSGDTKHLFADLLKQWIQLIEQMAAKALALGIINLLTGGAGGFLGGGGAKGKGNGGFLSVFGFDDATNDTKAARWGFDFGNKFFGGVADYNVKHTPLQGMGAGANRGAGDVHIHMTGDQHYHNEMDARSVAGEMARQVQVKLRMQPGTG